jgi:NTE family protein
MLPRRICYFLFALLLFVSFSFGLIAQDSQSSEGSERPSVGLVMSGGGAKGWAYLGVLRVLQEAGLEVDYIAGASAGSIVGGMYALGYHPDTIERIIRAQDWDAVMRDVIDRRYIAYQDKKYGGRYIFSLPIKDRKIGLKASLYEGQNIDLLLNRYYSVAYKDSLFSDFQTPFICIGTDLYDGKQVVLDRGYLPMAIRSSMAIPGYFAPVEYEDNLLVDGGVVNNYPVTPLKDIGVDIIVGADVQSRKKRTKEDLQNLTTILDQIIGYHRQPENEKGKQETDIYIHLKMNYSMMDFMNYDSIIQFGERVAREHFDKIKALADSLNAIEYRPLKSYNTVPLDSVEISDVTYSGYINMRRKFLESFFGEFRNKKIAIADLEEAVNYAFGTRFFQSVYYQLEYKQGKTNLIIKIKESEPGSISAGLHYDTDYKVSILANLAVRNLLGQGSKLFIDLVLGNYPLLRGLYMLDNGRKPGLGIDFDLYTFDFDTYIGEEKDNRYEFDNFSGSLFTPIIVNNVFAVKLGFQYQYFRFRQKIETDSISSGYNSFSSFGELYFELGADTRDKAYFSTRGGLVKFRTFYKIPFAEDWNQDLFDNVLVLFLKWNHNIPLANKISLQPGLFLGATFLRAGLIDYNAVIENEGYYPVPVQSRFWVGGLNQVNYLNTLIPFTGLKFIQSMGSYSAIGRLNLQYNFYGKLYATAMLDGGQNQMIWEDFWDARHLMVGYGLKLSYNSFVGPVEGSIMWSNMLPGTTFFLNIGFWL